MEHSDSYGYVHGYAHVRAKNSRHNASQRGAVVDPEFKDSQLARIVLDTSCCAVCFAETDVRDREIDHITPICQGGHHTASNVQILCPTCHKAKSRADSARFLRLPPAHYQRIRELRAEGLTQKRIAETVGCNVKTVRRALIPGVVERDRAKGNAYLAGLREQATAELEAFLNDRPEFLRDWWEAGSEDKAAFYAEYASACPGVVKFRRRHPDSSQTLAKLTVEGYPPVYGISGYVPRPADCPAGVSKLSWNCHAEGYVFSLAYELGYTGGKATLQTDHRPCLRCIQSFDGYEKALGLTGLVVTSPRWGIVNDVAAELRTRITDLPSGSVLPGPSKLCVDYGVCKYTMAIAMRMLIREGWVDRSGVGRGVVFTRTGQLNENARFSA